MLAKCVAAFALLKCKVLFYEFINVVLRYSHKMIQVISYSVNYIGQQNFYWDSLYPQYFLLISKMQAVLLYQV